MDGNEHDGRPFREFFRSHKILSFDKLTKCLKLKNYIKCP